MIKTFLNSNPQIVATAAKALGMTPEAITEVLTKGSANVDDATMNAVLATAASLCASTSFLNDAAQEEANADAAARMNSAIAPILLNDPAWFDDGYCAAVPMALLGLLGLYFATRMQREGLSDLAQSSATQLQLYAKRVWTELDALSAQGKIHPSLYLAVSLGLDTETAARLALRAAYGNRAEKLFSEQEDATIN